MLGDVEADFLVFYGIDHIHSMLGRRFFQMAYRLPAYDGAVARRILYDTVGFPTDPGAAKYLSITDLLTASQLSEKSDPASSSRTSVTTSRPDQSQKESRIEHREVDASTVAAIKSSAIGNMFD